jgi:hypothetical protein
MKVIIVKDVWTLSRGATTSRLGVYILIYINAYRCKHDVILYPSSSDGF